MRGTGKDAIIVEIAMQHNDGYTESIFSYVNNIPTTEGGTHETGFKSALTKVMNDYCRRTGILKEKDAPLPGEDFREGLTAVVSLKMSSIQFEGQTKTKLGNTEARTAVEAIVMDELTPILENLKNSDLAAAIADKAVKAAKAREAARKAKPWRVKSPSLKTHLSSASFQAARAEHRSKTNSSSLKAIRQAAARSRAVTDGSRQYFRCAANR